MARTLLALALVAALAAAALAIDTLPVTTSAPGVGVMYVAQFTAPATQASLPVLASAAATATPFTLYLRKSAQPTAATFDVSATAVSGVATAFVAATTGTVVYVGIVAGATDTFSLSYSPSVYCQGTRVLTASSGTFGDGSGGAGIGSGAQCAWTIQPSAPVNAVSLEFATNALVCYSTSTCTLSTPSMQFASGSDIATFLPAGHKTWMLGGQATLALGNPSSYSRFNATYGSSSDAALATNVITANGALSIAATSSAPARAALVVTPGATALLVSASSSSADATLTLYLGTDVWPSAASCLYAVTGRSPSLSLAPSSSNASLPSPGTYFVTVATTGPATVVLSFSDETLWGASRRRRDAGGRGCGGAGAKAGDAAAGGTETVLMGDAWTARVGCRGLGTLASPHRTAVTVSIVLPLVGVLALYISCVMLMCLRSTESPMRECCHRRCPCCRCLRINDSVLTARDLASAPVITIAKLRRRDESRKHR